MFPGDRVGVGEQWPAEQRQPGEDDDDLFLFLILLNSSDSTVSEDAGIKPGTVATRLDLIRRMLPFNAQRRPFPWSHFAYFLHVPGDRVGVG